MRLLITTDTVGGVWTFTSELTTELLERGHEVYLVSMGRDLSQPQKDWCTQQWRHFNERLTICPTVIPLEWMQNNEDVFEQGQKEILDDAACFRPDLILSNQFCFGRLDTPLPRIVVAHSDVLSWAKACRPDGLEPSPWLDRYNSLVQAGLRAAAAVAAPTFAMAKALVDHFPAPHCVTVIPNGVRVDSPGGAQPERRLQAITAGRLWDEAKGLDVLRDLNSPIPLLLAGDNTFESPDQARGWPPHLQNLGPLSRPDLHQLFRQSAIYICTSRYEPFGLAPLEAALCGCAVIARDLPSLREVWSDNALFFSEISTLTELLQALSSRPDLLADYQARALRRAQKFSPKRMADSYLDLFQSVLRQHQAMPHVA